jgi:hypothetical protein
MCAREEGKETGFYVCMYLSLLEATQVRPVSKEWEERLAHFAKPAYGVRAKYKEPSTIIKRGKQTLDMPILKNADWFARNSKAIERKRGLYE